MKKQWYEVPLQKSRNVLVYAEDENDACEKAERKVNKRNDAWMASGIAYLVDENNDKN